MKECVFCKIAKGEIKSEKIYENDNFFSIFDIHPQTPGHSLVIVKKHFKTPFNTTFDLNNSLGAGLLDCIKTTALKMMEKHKAEGFNIVSNNFPAAGQVVEHLHYHIVPRKKGDGLKMIA